tara:strand:+ start:17499 stop:17705 length:207 start_codon:yes stop_codon:yes gene_type:complete
MSNIPTQQHPLSRRQSATHNTLPSTYPAPVPPGANDGFLFVRRFFGASPFFVSKKLLISLPQPKNQTL